MENLLRNYDQAGKLCTQSEHRTAVLEVCLRGDEGETHTAAKVFIQPFFEAFELLKAEISLRLSTPQKPLRHLRKTGTRNSSVRACTNWFILWSLQRPIESTFSKSKKLPLKLRRKPWLTCYKMAIEPQKIKWRRPRFLTLKFLDGNSPARVLQILLRTKCRPLDSFVLF